jgi:hypothetical protein
MQQINTSVSEIQSSEQWWRHSAEMATSNIIPHSKAVIPIFNVIRYRLKSVVQQQQQTFQN